jgi:hypothetical protein
MAIIHANEAPSQVKTLVSSHWFYFHCQIVHFRILRKVHDCSTYVFSLLQNMFVICLACNVLLVDWQGSMDTFGQLLQGHTCWWYQFNCSNSSRLVYWTIILIDPNSRFRCRYPTLHLGFTCKHSYIIVLHLDHISCILKLPIGEGNRLARHLLCMQGVLLKFHVSCHVVMIDYWNQL